MFRLTCLFVATLPCVVHALILFSQVLENARYVARGLLPRLDYLGYLSRKLTCVNRAVLFIEPPVFVTIFVVVFSWTIRTLEHWVRFWEVQR